MKFTEARLEAAVIQLLTEQGYTHLTGEQIERTPHEVLLKADLRAYLTARYASDGITEREIDTIIRKLEAYPSADLYNSNRAIHTLIANGFQLPREDRTQPDLFIELLDTRALAPYHRPQLTERPLIVAGNPTPPADDHNIYKIVNQLEITGNHKRIPDGILYINGLPLVVFEFKSAIRENVTLEEAHTQLTVRYKRDIPDLFKYTAFCIISDGVNNRAGTLYSAYEFFYAWRQIDGSDDEKDGIDSLETMIHGLFNPVRLLDVIRNFVYFPDTSREELKILCRYPQYYATTMLYRNIVIHQRPDGDGKGGTYFGTTGCGKSYTMLFLTRLLMKSQAMASPTIVLITDRTDLDTQLSKQFTNAKAYIGDALVESIKSRDDLREKLHGRNAGGVFLTTIHKFTEDAQLLTARDNVICISDEAHRSQINLDQKVKVTAQGVQTTYGFAYYLHQSLPNATYVGFTGTPIDATLDVFGDVVDAYTMSESVKDGITVPLVYEGRAAKVLLDSDELQKIETYYAQCAEQGATEYAIEQSKKANISMNRILGDPDRLAALAADFVAHYETRIAEATTVAGKAMFVCSSRLIAYAFYQQLLAIRPEWGEIKPHADEDVLSDEELEEVRPSERVKLVMTRGKDDPEQLYKLVGSKQDQTELAKQFKQQKSNFKIAIVVDMWLTGFDVPFLDTVYIDKPIRQHNLIQTISRANRRFQGKHKGLIVDYIGIRKQMDLALAKYAQSQGKSVEDIEVSIIVVRDHLEMLQKIFHTFDDTPYYTGDALAQLNCLNGAAEFVQRTEQLEKRFMGITKRLKAAYDICVGTDKFTQAERDAVHFYMAVRSIVYKYTKGDAPDVAQMNRKVQQMLEDALSSTGVEELFAINEDEAGEIDLFSDDYLKRLLKIKLPNTKIKLLQKLLAQAIDQYKQVNRLKGVEFAKQFQSLVQRYNERDESVIHDSSILNDMIDDLTNMVTNIQKQMTAHEEMGLDFEEKAFYDILKAMCIKYNFTYPEDKLRVLAPLVKALVDQQRQYPDWHNRQDIRAALQVDLIMLLHEHGYPPVAQDDVYQAVIEQAENFKKYQK